MNNWFGLRSLVNNDIKDYEINLVMYRFINELF